MDQGNQTKNQKRIVWDQRNLGKNLKGDAKDQKGQGKSHNRVVKVKVVAESARKRL